MSLPFAFQNDLLMPDYEVESGLWHPSVLSTKGHLLVNSCQTDRRKRHLQPQTDEKANVLEIAKGPSCFYMLHRWLSKHFCRYSIYTVRYWHSLNGAPRDTSTQCQKELGTLSDWQQSFTSGKEAERKERNFYDEFSESPFSFSAAVRSLCNDKMS